jgi:hypothetical protein
MIVTSALGGLLFSSLGQPVITGERTVYLLPLTPSAIGLDNDFRDSPG